MKDCCITANLFGVTCLDCNPRKRSATPKQKNLCLKTRPKDNPYEVWKDNSGWTWNVLKKYQADDSKPFARWFCFVISPIVPGGEFGDCYVKDIVNGARKVQS